jgi:hypothetical protein
MESSIMATELTQRNYPPVEIVPKVEIVSPDPSGAAEVDAVASIADPTVSVPSTERLETPIDPHAVPVQGERRWRKRLLLIAAGTIALGAIFWATSNRVALLKRPDQIASQFDPSILDVAARVDADFDAQWQSRGLQSAPSAQWNTVARRLSLAMVGNSLSLEEYRALERLPESERVVWWTEYLLQDRRWADYLAERWTRATVGTNEGPFLLFRRRKYRTWLADQFQDNLPYDQLVRRLITAKGSWIDSPEVNFLTATMDEADNGRPDAIRLAGRTSRAFLAMRIDCLQCHNDYLGNVKFKTADADEPTRTGEQTDFHQLAAFYSGVRMENAFSGLVDRPPEYPFQYLNADAATDVSPAVPFDSSLCAIPGSDKDTLAHREALAQWVTHRDNRPFARAAVNRMWAVMTGKPLISPVDDIPIAGPFPPGLEILAEDFSSHGFDLQRLIRIIVATQVFQRDSQLEDGEWTDAHELSWAVFPMTQLRPEQMAACIQQACRLKAIDASSSIVSQLEMFGVVNDFTAAYGDRGDNEFQEQSVTIPQRLLVMNGKFISERIDRNPVMNAATRIANLSMDDRTAIDSAYISALNRLPNDAERSHFTQKLQGLTGDARSGEMSNLYWVLLNSSEFQWNH